MARKLRRLLPLFRRPFLQSFSPHLLRPSVITSPSSPSGAQSRAFDSLPEPTTGGFSDPFSTAAVPPCNERERSVQTKLVRNVNSVCMDFSSKSNLDIGKSVISKCSYLWDKKADALVENSCLLDLLKQYAGLSPATTRRFYRFSSFKPEDFLEVALGVATDCMASRKVEFLWKLFIWAENQSSNFLHLPRSYMIMISMLTYFGKLEDAESLLLAGEKRRVLTHSSKFFSEVIQGYAEACKLDNAMALYGTARDMGIIPSGLCYISLLNLLIAKDKTNNAVRVYIDMVEVGLGPNSKDRILDYVVGGLTKNGKILESVNLMRQLRSCGVKVSDKALSAVAKGLCGKKDFDDLLNHLKEWNHVPEARICNKIISSICRDLSTEEAWLFLQQMLVSGFTPDATTFSILICQSCKEKKLRDSFVYLSECFSRGVIPNLYAYNAILSGIFREGLHEHAKVIFEDIVDRGLVPDLSTLSILLAGYCQHKKFEDVKEVLTKMATFGFISLSPVDDTLAKALAILGLDHLHVKLKRDDHAGISRAEFFDSLGNGLYLDTDIDEYETSLSLVLDNLIFPNFDSMLIKHCGKGDIEAALRLKAEIFQWAPDLSLSAYSRLLEDFLSSPLHISDAIIFLDEMPKLLEQLDGQALNLITRKLSENERLSEASSTLEMLLKKDLMVETATFTTLLVGFCNERDISGLKNCLDLAARSAWSPGSKDIAVLMSNLCSGRLVKEVLELLDKIIKHYPELISDSCNILISHLCITGFMTVACTLVEEIVQRNIILDSAAYQNIIKEFLNEQKFAEAFGMFHIMLENNIMIPCETACRLLLPSFFRFSMIDEAIVLKRFLIFGTPETRSSFYNASLNEFCRRGKMNGAIHELHEMLESSLFPDDNALNAMVSGFCLQDNWAKARGTLCAMIRRHVNLSISAYRAVVRQMLMKGEYLGAIRIKELTNNETPELILYNILIFYLFQARKSSIVECVLRRMHDNCIFPDKATYDIMTYGFHKCGDVIRSIGTLNAIISKGLRPSNRSLRIVICHFCSSGNFEGALELSKIMQHKKWKHDSVVQSVLVSEYITRGRLLEANLFLRQLEKNDLVVNSTNYDFLIKQFCLQGGITEAVHLLNVMLKKGNIPNEMSYSAVIHGLCLQKAFDQALDLHVEMQINNLQLCEESCYVLVCGLCDEGRADNAREALRRMLRPGSSTMYNMYNRVFDSYYLNNNLEKASEFLQEMQQAGFAPKFESHWSLIRNLTGLDHEDDCSGKNFLSDLLSQDCSRKYSKEKNDSAFKKKTNTSLCKSLWIC